MIKIRLSRAGAKKNAFYRIVAIEHQRKRGGKPIAILGFWYPKKDQLEIKRAKLETLLAKGAQVSQTVGKLISK